MLRRAQVGPPPRQRDSPTGTLLSERRYTSRSREYARAFTPPIETVSKLPPHLPDPHLDCPLIVPLPGFGGWIMVAAALRAGDASTFLVSVWLQDACRWTAGLPAVDEAGGGEMSPPSGLLLGSEAGLLIPVAQGPATRKKLLSPAALTDAQVRMRLTDVCSH